MAEYDKFGNEILGELSEEDKLRFTGEEADEPAPQTDEFGNEILGDITEDDKLRLAKGLVRDFRLEMGSDIAKKTPEYQAAQKRMSDAIRSASPLDQIPAFVGYPLTEKGREITAAEEERNKAYTAAGGTIPKMEFSPWKLLFGGDTGIDQLTEGVDTLDALRKKEDVESILNMDGKRDEYVATALKEEWDYNPKGYNVRPNGYFTFSPALLRDRDKFSTALKEANIPQDRATAALELFDENAKAERAGLVALAKKTPSFKNYADRPENAGKSDEEIFSAYEKSGGFLSWLSSNARSIPQQAANYTASMGAGTMLGIDALLEKGGLVEGKSDDPLVQVARGLTEYTRNAVPYDVRYSNTAGQTVGQLAPQMVILGGLRAAMSRVLGKKGGEIAANALTAISSGVQIGAENYNTVFEANKEQFGEEKAHEMALKDFKTSVPIGITELLSLDILMSKTPVTLRGKVLKNLASAISEVATEQAQTKISNAINKESSAEYIEPETLGLADSAEMFGATSVIDAAMGGLGAIGARRRAKIQAAKEGAEKVGATKTAEELARIAAEEEAEVLKTSEEIVRESEDGTDDEGSLDAGSTNAPIPGAPPSAPPTTTPPASDTSAGAIPPPASGATPGTGTEAPQLEFPLNDPVRPPATPANGATGTPGTGTEAPPDTTSTAPKTSVEQQPNFITVGPTAQPAPGAAPAEEAPQAGGISQSPAAPTGSVNPPAQEGTTAPTTSQNAAPTGEQAQGGETNDEQQKEGQGRAQVLTPNVPANEGTVPPNLGEAAPRGSIEPNTPPDTSAAASPTLSPTPSESVADASKWAAYDNNQDPADKGRRLEALAGKVASDDDLNGILDRLDETAMGSQAWRVADAVAKNKAASQATKTRAESMREEWMRPGRDEERTLAEQPTFSPAPQATPAPAASSGGVISKEPPAWFGQAKERGEIKENDEESLVAAVAQEPADEVIEALVQVGAKRQEIDFLKENPPEAGETFGEWMERTGADLSYFDTRPTRYNGDLKIYEPVGEPITTRLAKAIKGEGPYAPEGAVDTKEVKSAEDAAFEERANAPALQPDAKAAEEGTEASRDPEVSRSPVTFTGADRVLKSAKYPRLPVQEITYASGAVRVVPGFVNDAATVVETLNYFGGGERIFVPDAEVANVDPKKIKLAQEKGTGRWYVESAVHPRFPAVRFGSDGKVQGAGYGSPTTLVELYQQDEKRRKNSEAQTKNKEISLPEESQEYIDKVNAAPPSKFEIEQPERLEKALAAISALADKLAGQTYTNNDGVVASIGATMAARIGDAARNKYLARLRGLESGNPLPSSVVEDIKKSLLPALKARTSETAGVSLDQTVGEGGAAIGDIAVEASTQAQQDETNSPSSTELENEDAESGDPYGDAIRQAEWEVRATYSEEDMAEIDEASKRLTEADERGRRKKPTKAQAALLAEFGLKVKQRAREILYDKMPGFDSDEETDESASGGVHVKPSKKGGKAKADPFEKVLGDILARFDRTARELPTEGETFGYKTFGYTAKSGKTRTVKGKTRAEARQNLKDNAAQYFSFIDENLDALFASGAGITFLRGRTKGLVPSILETIAGDKSQPKWLRFKVAMLLKSGLDLSQIKFNVVVRPYQKDPWAGLYTPNTSNGREGLVSINLGVPHEGSVAQTIVHEIFHHVSLYKLRPQFKRNAVEEAAYQDFLKIFKSFRRQTVAKLGKGKSFYKSIREGTNDMNALRNPDEFLAELFSNQEFAEWVATLKAVPGIKYKGGLVAGLYNQLKHTIKTLVAGVDVRPGSLISQALDNGFIIIRETPSDENIDDFYTRRAEERITKESRAKKAARAKKGELVPGFEFRTKLAIDKMLDREGGEFKGLTPSPDGTLPWENLSAKIGKTMRAEEADMVLPILETLKVKGRVNAKEAAKALTTLANSTAKVVELSARDSDVSTAQQTVAQLEHNLDTEWPGWSEIIARDDFAGEAPTARAAELLAAWTNSSNAPDNRESATARYTMVNPKPLDQMEDAKDLTIEEPSSGTGEQTAEDIEVKFEEDIHFPTRKNVIGFGRMYTETLPNGEKATFVFEVQSDWASKKAKNKANAEREATPVRKENLLLEVADSPLLSVYESLVLKAAIQDALAKGQTKLVLTDAETAMMTEGHDLVAESNIPNDLSEKQLNEAVKDSGEFSQIRVVNGIIEEVSPRGQLLKQLGSFSSTGEIAFFDLDFNRVMVSKFGKPTISQAAGMEAAYDKNRGRLHDIMRKLTGDKGTPVDLGVHQNAGIAEERPWEITHVDMPDMALAFFASKEEAETELDFQKQFGDYNVSDDGWAISRRANIGSPVFRNADGTPKTNITGIVYDLSKLAEAPEGVRTLFAATRETGEASTATGDLSPEATEVSQIASEFVPPHVTLTTQAIRTNAAFARLGQDGNPEIVIDPQAIAEDTAGYSPQDRREYIEALMRHENIHSAGLLGDYMTPDASGRLGKEKMEAFHDEVMTPEMRSETAEAYVRQFPEESDAAYQSRKEAFLANKEQVASEYKRIFVERYLTGRSQEEIVDLLESRAESGNFKAFIDGIIDYLKGRLRWLEARWQMYRDPRIKAEVMSDLRVLRMLNDRSGKTLDMLVFEDDMKRQAAWLNQQAKAEGYASIEEAPYALQMLLAAEWRGEAGDGVAEGMASRNSAEVAINVTEEEAARFNELTADLQGRSLTQADIDAWKRANPEKYAELERMRETWVLENYVPPKDRIARFLGRKDVQFVPLKDLVRFAEVDRSDPRAVFSDLDKLAQNLRRNGIQEPLIFGVTKDNRGLVTDGNHRLIAAKEAGINWVPVVVEPITAIDPEWGVRTPKGFRGKWVGQRAMSEFGFETLSPEKLSEQLKLRSFTSVLVGAANDEEIKSSSITVNAKGVNAQNHGTLGLANFPYRWRFRPFTGLLSIQQETPERIREEIVSYIRKTGNRVQRVLPLGDPKAFRETHSTFFSEMPYESPLERDDKGILVSPDKWKAKWKDDESTDIRYANERRTLGTIEELDAPYFAALERGDMAAVQQMVDDAAKRAGYTVQGYHGSDTPNIFEFRTTGGHEMGPGAYFTPEAKRAAKYGKYVTKAFLKVENPVAFGWEAPSFVKGLWSKLEGTTNSELNASARRAGHDAVVKYWSSEGDGSPVEVAVFNPEQIKSAEPVTRDSDGNVIPLSERFNTESPDLRYAPRKRRRKVDEGGWKESGVLKQGKMDMRVFDRMQQRDAELRGASYKAKATVQKFNRLVKKYTPDLTLLREALGTTDNRLDDAQQEQYLKLKRMRGKDADEKIKIKEAADKYRMAEIRKNIAMHEKKQEEALKKLPPDLAESIVQMREGIKAFNNEMMRKGMLTADMEILVDDNKEVYLNRSYEIFDNPDWADFVMHDASPEAQTIRVNASKLLRSELIAQRAKEIRREARTAGTTVPSVADSVKIASALVTNDDVQNRMIEYLKVATPHHTFSGPREMGVKNMGILKMRGQLPSEIRALWGEYMDPATNYARTYMKLATFVADHNFQQDFLDMGLKNGFLWKAGMPGAAPGTGYPLGWELVYPTMKNDGSSPNPMAGVYGPPVIQEVMKEAQEVIQHKGLMKAVMMATGFAMASKTVLNIPQANTRNFLGNTLIVGANGYITQDLKFLKRFAKAANVTAPTAVGLRTERKQAIVDYIERLTKLNIMGDNVKANVVKALTEVVFSKSPETSWMDMQEKAWSRVKDTYERAVDAYGAVDDIWKIVAFETERDLMERAHTTYEVTPATGATISFKTQKEADAFAKKHKLAAPVKKGPDSEALDRMAADRVVAVLPTYSRIPAVVQNFVKKQPYFAPFISWTSEILRVSANAVVLAGKDVTSGNRTLAVSGAKRLATLTASQFLLGALAKTVRDMVAKMTDDDERDLRRFLPEWQKDALLMLLNKGKDGEVTFIDLSFLNPYSTLQEPFIAVNNALDDDKGIMSALAAGGSKFMDPWTSEQLFLGAVASVSRGVDASGRPLWNEATPWKKKAWTGATTIGTTMLPGTINIGRRIWMAATDRMPSSGRAYNLTNELIGPVVGQRIAAASPSQNFDVGKVSAFNRMIGAARQNATQAYRNRGTINLNAIKQDYVDANKAQYRAFVELRKDIDSLRRLGVSEQSIMESLNRIPKNDRDQILNGVYVKIIPSKETRNAVMINNLPNARARIEALNKAIEQYPEVQKITRQSTN